MKKPNVLVIGINPWIDNTGINTLISLFSEWGKSSLAHIYTRDKLPSTCICDRFFQISEKKLIRSVFDRRIKTGNIVYNSPDTYCNENNLYNHKSSAFASLLREFVWLFGKWKTNELNTFLDNFNPDVLFFPVYSTVYMSRLQRYVAMYTQKPVILYSSDDNFSFKSVSKTPLSLFLRMWLRRLERDLFKIAKKVIVISPKQKEEYDSLFNTDCTIITKGIDFSKTEYQDVPVNNPIRMVYTGKVIIGRGETLGLISDAMAVVNKGGDKILLDIYTTDKMSSRLKIKLNSNGCTLKGTVGLKETWDIQSNADVLVFVEGLNRKNRYKARLSFSTKITDYLKSGKCIFAVGNDKIAPIDYFKRFDSALTATSFADILEKLEFIADNPEIVKDYGKKAFECGKIHHNKAEQHLMLYNCIGDVFSGQS